VTIADIFHKALPEARKKGIRMIAVNRRHYPGSTPYLPEELAPLKLDETDIPKCLLFLQHRGLELIGFIHRIVEKLGLPTLGPDGSGMITVLGHSIGNIHTLSLARCFQNESLPTLLKEVKEWISGIIIFGNPFPTYLSTTAPSNISHRSSHGSLWNKINREVYLLGGKGHV
jgi:hypothetical protein